MENDEKEGHDGNERRDEYVISPWDILLYLARNLKIIIIIPSITSLLSIFYVLFIAEPVYEAEAKLLPSTTNPSSNIAGIAARFGINPLSDTNLDISSGDIYPQIIKSRTLAKSLLQRKFNTNKYGSDKSLLSILML